MRRINNYNALFLPVLRADLTPSRLEILTALCHITNIHGAKQPVTCLVQIFTIQFSKAEGKISHDA